MPPSRAPKPVAIEPPARRGPISVCWHRTCYGDRRRGRRSVVMVASELLDAMASAIRGFLRPGRAAARRRKAPGRCRRWPCTRSRMCISGAESGAETTPPQRNSDRTAADCGRHTTGMAEPSAAGSAVVTRSRVRSCAYERIDHVRRADLIEGPVGCASNHSASLVRYQLIIARSASRCMSMSRDSVDHVPADYAVGAWVDPLICANGSEGMMLQRPC